MKRTAIAGATLGLLVGLVAPQVISAANSTAPAPAAVEVATLPQEPFWAYPLCAVEDASSGPLPCLWPADKVGNGEGHTFYVEPGANGARCFHYVNPTQDRKRGGCE